jgi:ADP-dependent NAD(P)H-hydrate dehydratase / NAD(P)H-hydrate epimerase
VRPILTPAESADLDRASAERGVTVDSLMERAGRAVARAAVALAGGAYGRRVVAVCGKGNNGGDALVAARYLRRWGMGATAVLLAEPDAYRDAAGVNLDRARRAGVAVATAADLRRELARADVVLDGVVGTGFRGTPEGAVGEAIGAIGGDGAAVVAVDIASGVDGATGAVDGPAVAADATVTFGSLKPAHVLFPGAAYAGVVEVADIGFPPDLVVSDLWQVEAEDVGAVLPARAPDAHKRSTGIVLVVGGSRAMTGAVRLMAGAAYRTGAGLVQVGVPEGILPVVQTGLVEATFTALPETGEGTIAESAVDALKERLADADALAVGPGLGRNEDTLAFVRALVQASPVPCVIDADGLTAFAGRLDELAEMDSADLVLTPHAGEFARLSGGEVAEVNADRVGSVRALASQAGAVVLFKGNPTVVGLPGGEVGVNSTGGPALATGGTGDVLTGVIAALLARGLQPADAAMAGAFVHGLAGDLAGGRLGDGATALDVQAHVPAAIRSILGGS